MFDYDVVLSFAGEDRNYVERVAEKLKKRGIKVFYDYYETSLLWGKDLAQYLNNIYKNKAEYCIMFISKKYKEKRWCIHELRSALSREFKNRKEYILPIILDETNLDEIDGLNITTGYLKASEHTLNEIVDYVEEKITRKVNIFACCNDITDLFKQSITKIQEASRTDYNQIILNAAIGSHAYGLVVIADAIAYWKQKYRIVVMDGIINKCFKSGKLINISNVHNEQGYFQAVYETKSELVIPIRSLENVVGVINIESEEINHFNSDIINEINVISKHFGKMLNELKFDNGYYNNIPYISLSLEAGRI